MQQNGCQCCLLSRRPSDEVRSRATEPAVDGYKQKMTNDFTLETQHEAAGASGCYLELRHTRCERDVNSVAAASEVLQGKRLPRAQQQLEHGRAGKL